MISVADFRARYRGAFSRTAYYGLTWKTWRAVARRFASINFGCEWENEICRAKRKRGCCGGCAAAAGHHRLLPHSEKNLAYLAQRFDSRTGFLRPDGCALPHEHRSLICLTHICKALDLLMLDERERVFLFAVIDRRREELKAWAQS